MIFKSVCDICCDYDDNHGCSMIHSRMLLLCHFKLKITSTLFFICKSTNKKLLFKCKQINLYLYGVSYTFQFYSITFPYSTCFINGKFCCRVAKHCHYNCVGHRRKSRSRSHDRHKHDRQKRQVTRLSD